MHFPSNREAIGRVLLFFYPRKHSLPSCGHNFFPLVKGFLAVLCSCTPRPFPCWRSDLGFSSLKLWKVFLELFLLKGTVHCFCSLNLKIGKYLVHMTLSFRDGLYSLGYEILLCVAISHFQLNSSTLSVLGFHVCEFLQTKPQDLDFKHRQTEEALWISRCSNPPWIRSKLSILLTQGGAQLHYCSNFQVRLEAPGHQDGKQRYFSGHTHQKKEQ